MIMDYGLIVTSSNSHSVLLTLTAQLLHYELYGAAQSYLKASDLSQYVLAFFCDIQFTAPLALTKLLNSFSLFPINFTIVGLRLNCYYLFMHFSLARQTL
jgi:hypothetical protein